MALLHLAFVVTLFVKTSFACNGMKISDLKIASCDGRELVQNIDFTADLDKDCNIIPTGCFEVQNDIQSGNFTYSLEKKGVPPLKFKGKDIICSTLENSKSNAEVSMAMKLVKLPNHCPIPKGKLCGNGKMSIEKYKSHIKAGEGEYSGKIIANTNAGQSCMSIYAKVINTNSKTPSMPTFG